MGFPRAAASIILRRVPESDKIGLHTNPKLPIASNHGLYL